VEAGQPCSRAFVCVPPIHGPAVRRCTSGRQGDGQHGRALPAVNERSLDLASNAGNEVAQLGDVHVVALEGWIALLDAPLSRARQVVAEAVLVEVPAQDAVFADKLDAAPR